MKDKFKYYIFKSGDDSSVLCYESLAEVLDYFFKNKITIFVVIVVGDCSYRYWLGCEDDNVDFQDVGNFCSYLCDIQNGVI